MAAKFLSNTSGEFLKTKRTAAFWLTLLGAAFVPIINFIKCVARPDVFVPRYKANVWNIFINENWEVASAFLLVVYIILVTGLVIQIEYRNNTWKQVYASPRTYADIFFSKLIVMLVMILLCFILFNVFIILSGLAINLARPNYNFYSTPIPLMKMLLLSGRMFIAISGIIGIQYFLSLRFRNFIVPMAMGLGLLIAGFIIRQWEHIDYYPYMYGILAYFKNPGLPQDALQKVLIHSVLWFGLFLGLGFGYSVWRRERG